MRKKVYFISLAVIFILSAYPLYMGVALLKDYISLGAVSAENYPNYIIPYTPICIAVLASTILLPLFSRIGKRLGFAAMAVFAIVVFFAFELTLENVTLFAPSGITSVGNWQMYMCAVTPEVMQEINGSMVYSDVPEIIVDDKAAASKLLIGEYSPAFKIHFYLISLVMILAALNCVWGFYHWKDSEEKRKKNMLFLQLAMVAVFIALCIFACFTAFFREGNLRISPLSAVLTSIFFIVFGITFGVFLCSLMHFQNHRVIRILSALGAAAMSSAMYVGEFILLGGNLYRFGDGIFFESMGKIALAPVDVLVIVLSGTLTYAAASVILKGSAANQDILEKS